MDLLLLRNEAEKIDEGIKICSVYCLHKDMFGIAAWGVCFLKLGKWLKH